MAQAKKKKKKVVAKKTVTPHFSAHGTGMLLSGIVIGVLATLLWQGLRSDDSDVGSGIRQMLEQSRQRANQPEEIAPAIEVEKEPQSTNYDFFTVLPEIEVVVPSDEPEPKVVQKKPKETANAESVTNESTNNQTVKAEPVKPVEAASAYMLQAGSYQRQNDADRQKAKLAFIGLTSSIQKITIQGRGDFYRVRLGPFSDHQKMVKVDDRLKKEGIKAMRLKISKPG